MDLHYIHEALRPFAVSMNDLVPDPENARVHDAASVASIKASLIQFGQDVPLVVQRSGMIIRKGNGRFLAAKELGWTHVACVIVDEGDVEATARAIADNRTAEKSRWDGAVLARLIGRLQESGKSGLSESVGFSEEEVARLAGVFRPNTKPDTTAASGVTQEDLARAGDALLRKTTGTPPKLIETYCPECGHQFYVDPASEKGPSDDVLDGVKPDTGASASPA